MAFRVPNPLQRLGQGWDHLRGWDSVTFEGCVGWALLMLVAKGGERTDAAAEQVHRTCCKRTFLRSARTRGAADATSSSCTFGRMLRTTATAISHKRIDT